MRYFIELSYNGARYHGWQIQKNAISVEEVLEHCFSQLLRKRIDIIGVGRTDRGVHAKIFFAHFDYPQYIEKKFVKKINAFLPYDIKIHKLYEVTMQAHARFSAITRSYVYFMSLGKDPFIREFSWQWYSTPPNLSSMNQASEILKKYQDFSSFCKLRANHTTSICKIESAKWQLKKNLFIFKITANRFLRNMVRTIVGTMLAVGQGKIDLHEFCKIIESKDRKQAGISVPAKGLFLSNVCYPKYIFL